MTTNRPGRAHLVPVGTDPAAAAGWPEVGYVTGDGLTRAADPAPVVPVGARVTVAIPFRAGAPVPAAKPTHTYTVPIAGIYQRCAWCLAPVVEPFPPGWSVSLYQIGATVAVMPHRPNCRSARLANASASTAGANLSRLPPAAAAAAAALERAIAAFRKANPDG